LIPRWPFPQLPIHRVTLSRPSTPILVLRDDEARLRTACLDALRVAFAHRSAARTGRFVFKVLWVVGFVKFDKIRSFWVFLEHWQRAFL
jgi:hypothetical protein